MKKLSGPRGRLSSATIENLHLTGLSIRNARIGRRMTREQVAERIPVGRSTVRRIEKGAPEVALGYYLAVAELVGIALLAPTDATAMLASARAARGRARPEKKDWF